MDADTIAILKDVRRRANYVAKQASKAIKDNELPTEEEALDLMADCSLLINALNDLHDALDA